MIGYVKTAIAAAALAALAAGATHWHVSRVSAAKQAVHAHYATVLGEVSRLTAEADSKFRTQEKAWATAFTQEAKNGQIRISEAQRSAATARRERDGLLTDLAHYRAAARASAHSRTAEGGETAATAVDLLADLFGAADQVAGELAAALDHSYAAGTTCERAVDSLPSPRRPDGGNY